MLALLTQGYLDAFGDTVLVDNRIAAAVGRQFRHVAWEGFAFWDLIQPAFLFLVGAAIPYALHSKCARNVTLAREWLQVLRRSLVLMAVALVILSENSARTEFRFADDALGIIALAYPFAWFLAQRTFRVQVVAAGSLLCLYWLAFATHPLPIANNTDAIPADWQPFTGSFAHWNRGGNFAADFDRWLLNLLPRETEFRYDNAGLATLNFIPSIVTILFGSFAGRILRSDQDGWQKLRLFMGAGVGCVMAGYVLGITVCPLVKAIWTPSWTVFSAGWVFLMLAAFYWLIDLRHFKDAAFPVVALGMNCLPVYAMIHLMRPWMWNAMEKHLGPMSWTLHSFLVGFTIWCVAYWMYRRRIIITA